MTAIPCCFIFLKIVLRKHTFDKSRKYAENALFMRFFGHPEHRFWMPKILINRF